MCTNVTKWPRKRLEEHAAWQLIVKAAGLIINIKNLALSRNGYRNNFWNEIFKLTRGNTDCSDANGTE